MFWWFVQFLSFFREWDHDCVVKNCKREAGEEVAIFSLGVFVRSFKMILPRKWIQKKKRRNGANKFKIFNTEAPSHLIPESQQTTKEISSSFPLPLETSTCFYHPVFATVWLTRNWNGSICSCVYLFADTRKNEWNGSATSTRRHDCQWDESRRCICQ